MIDERFVFLALALIFVGDFSYLVDTIKGKIKPNKVSWFLWGVPSLIIFIAQLNQGIGIFSFTSLAFGIPCFLIFFASFLNKKAYWKINVFDLGCGILSLAGLLLWNITKVGNWAILFAVLSDGLATLPTLSKSIKAPETENYLAYLFNGLGALVTVMLIQQWDFAHYIFPLYLISLNAILFPLIKFKLGKRFKYHLDRFF